MTLAMNRRSFIRSLAAASGAVLFPISFAGAETAKAGAEFLSWIVINPDSSVTYIVPQTELGQAVSTTIPQMLADELDADWSLLKVEFYDPALSKARGTPYGWTTTLGSSSAHYLFDAARLAAAQVRAMLIAAAAGRLNVPEGELTAADSMVAHVGSGQKLTFAELAAEAAALTPPAAEAITFKTAAERKLIGKPVPRLDLAQATHGGIEYGIDVDLPDMRHAVIRQSPTFGGSLAEVDDSALAALPGNPKLVRVKGAFVGYNSPVPEGEDPDLWTAPVNIDDCVAVVADSWWQAQSALDALKITWNDGPNAGFSTEGLHKHLAGMIAGDLPVMVDVGNVDVGLKGAAKTLSAEYVYPFMDPAPMEPLNCAVLVEPRQVTVWAGTQYADDAHRIAAELTGTPAENVKLVLMRCGGGFGRRLENDFVHQAVTIAMTMPGTPVKLLWTREECIARSCYSPYTVVRYDGGLDADGKITAWSCKIASARSAEQSYGGTHLPFFFPNMRINYGRDKTTPLPFGWMRGVGMTQHLWMNHSFLAELGSLAGKGQIELLRELLDPALIPAGHEQRDALTERAAILGRVLDAAAEKAEWGRAVPAGSGRGIMVADTAYYIGYASSTKAAVVDVTLADGKIHVDKVAITVDAGTIINPDVVRAQLEGGVVYALNCAFLSEITVENGRVQQSNFDDYPLLQIDRIPEIEINILPSEGAPLSIGEDSVPITLAALVNAIADAGGPRVRSLPIKDLELI